MKKHMMMAIIASIITHGAAFAAAAGRPVGRDINDLMKWKVARGFGTKMPEIDKRGELNLSNMGLASLNGIEKIVPKERWKVRSLRLDRNQLSELHPATINLFPNLEALYLQDNRISRINMGTFTGLDRMRTLNLSDNQIQTIDPTVLHGLVNLKRLDLSHNPLEEFEEDTFNQTPNIESLNFDNTYLTEFSIDQFRYNPRLGRLSLQNVPLNEFMLEKINRVREGLFQLGGNESVLGDYESDDD